MIMLIKGEIQIFIKLFYVPIYMKKIKEKKMENVTMVKIVIVPIIYMNIIIILINLEQSNVFKKRVVILAKSKLYVLTFIKVIQIMEKEMKKK